MKILSIILLWCAVSAVSATQTNWLSLESEGVHIHKLYGLTGKDYLTVNVFSVPAQNEAKAIDKFYELIDKDMNRISRIFTQYHVQLTTIPGISVITTMRRCFMNSGKPTLVHYHGFFIEDQQQMWYVRTELNNKLSLLTQHYSEILDHLFMQMDIDSTQ
ncbi:MAG: hypothetical protein P8163_04960 [Candidatus Thiodiazotropha sp.]